MLLSTRNCQTTWGSREGADANDDYRMIRLPGYEAPGPSRRKPRFDLGDIRDDIVSESSPLLPPYDAPSVIPFRHARFAIKDRAEIPHHPIHNITTLYYRTFD